MYLTKKVIFMLTNLTNLVKLQSMTTALKEYVDKDERSVDDFAQAVGVTPVSFYRYMNGTRNPKPGIATKIVKACNDHVSFESLFSS